MQNLERMFVNMTRRAASADFVSEADIVDDGAHCFVIVRPRPGAEVAAYALLELHGRRAEIVQLFSRVKGKGYGRLALRSAENVALAEGATSLVAESVPTAVGFYLAQGYVPGERDNVGRVMMFKALGHA